MTPRVDCCPFPSPPVSLVRARVVVVQNSATVKVTVSGFGIDAVVKDADRKPSVFTAVSRCACLP